MRRWKRFRWLFLIGIVVGFTFGYVYYRFEHPHHPKTAITNNLTSCILYGGAIGGLGFSLLHPSNRKKRR